MSEHLLWERTRDGMGSRWHAQRHEDRYSTGIPDVSYGCRGTQGWIELKFLKQMPARVNRPFDFALDHFTVDQRNWLSLRRRHSPFVWLMAEIGPVTAIWDWRQLRLHLGREPIMGVLEKAHGLWWHGPVDYDELRTILASGARVPCRYLGS